MSRGAIDAHTKLWRIYILFYERYHRIPAKAYERGIHIYNFIVSCDEETRPFLDVRLVKETQLKFIKIPDTINIMRFLIIT